MWMTQTLTSTPLDAIAQELPHLIERMHRRYLDVVRVELSRHRVNDISPVQVMMLVTIGQEEITVRDLIERGYYLSSNASYNLKNLIDGGYVERQTATRDRRSAVVKLSPKGHAILDIVTALNKQKVQALLDGDIGPKDTEAAWRVLRRLERLWSDALLFDNSEAGYD